MGKRKDSKQSRVKSGLRKKDKDVEVEIPEDYGAVIDIVKDFWLTLSKEQQLRFLTVSVNELKEQAKTIQETTIKELDKLQKDQVVDVEFQPDTCERALEQGLKRMRQGRTCKEWIWTRNNVNYTSAQEFRQYIVDNHIPEELRECLPADSATEAPAEKNLRKRMSEVGRKVQVLGGWTQEYQFSNGNGGSKGGGQKRTRKWAIKEPKALYEKHVEVLLYMLNSLEKEHGFLQEFVFVPVQSFMREALGSAQFDVIDFSSDDLHRLHQEDVYSIIEWVIEKIEMLSSKWKLDPEEDLEEGDQEENVAEIDLFKLTEDQQSLIVEPKWFDHLADRILGTDGTPKKRTESSPEKQGLVLDWIYGMIVSTAERAREACRHALGQRVPCFEHALNLFTRALQIQCIYMEVEKVLQCVVDDMQSGDGSEAEVVLYRNCLAHKARALCSLMEAWTFNKQFKQYRPSKEFDHMQLLSHIMKTVHNPGNKMESCSSVLLEDFPNTKQRQTELISKVFGTKFCTQLNKIIGAYDSKKVIDHLGLMLCFEWASKHAQNAPSIDDLPLLSETEIKKELGCVTQRLNQLSQKIVEGTAALHHLEMNLINLACEDPGALISMHLALPIIQKKLYYAARAHAEERANAVCEDLISSIQQEEMRKEAKRQSKKKKKKPKVVEENEKQEEGEELLQLSDSANLIDDNQFNALCEFDSDDNDVKDFIIHENFDTDQCFIETKFIKNDSDKFIENGSDNQLKEDFEEDDCTVTLNNCTAEEFCNEDFSVDNLLQQNNNQTQNQENSKVKVDACIKSDFSLDTKFVSINKFDDSQKSVFQQDKSSVFQQNQNSVHQQNVTDLRPKFQQDQINTLQNQEENTDKNNIDTSYIDETIFIMDSTSSDQSTNSNQKMDNENLPQQQSPEPQIKTQLQQQQQDDQNSEMMAECSFDDGDTCAYAESEEGCLSCSGPFVNQNHHKLTNQNFSTLYNGGDQAAPTSSKCSVTQEEQQNDQQKNVDRCSSSSNSSAVHEPQNILNIQNIENQQVINIEKNFTQDKVLSPRVQSLITTPTPTVRDAVSEFNGSEDSPIYGIERKKPPKNNQIDYQVFHPLLADLWIQQQQQQQQLQCQQLQHQIGGARVMSPESSYSRTQLEELPSFDIWDTPIDCLNDTITTSYGAPFPKGYNGGRLDGVLPTDILVCPITKSFFSDPVVAADGNTYERKAIEIWMSYFTHSPVTGDKLAHKMLIPNHLVKCMIDGIRQSQQQANFVG